jgi:hypothetical protein
VQLESLRQKNELSTKDLPPLFKNRLLGERVLEEELDRELHDASSPLRASVCRPF